MEASRILTSQENSTETLGLRMEIYHKIYSNGIVGKEAEGKLRTTFSCENMTPSDCHLKIEILTAVGTEKIFKYALGQSAAPKWTGLANWAENNDIDVEIVDEE